MMKTVFLDRDGVLNPLISKSEELISPQNMEEYRLFSGVEESIRRLKESGYRILVITNQPDVEKGWRELDFEKLSEINKFLIQKGVDKVYSCTHGPIGDKEDKHYSECGSIVTCDCRKPQPGLLEKADRDHEINFSKSYLIGDNETDIESAKAFEANQDVSFAGKLLIGGKQIVVEQSFDNFNQATDYILRD